MRRLRSSTAQSPAIVISIAALVFSLGSGTYAATALTGRQNGPASPSGWVARHDASPAAVPATQLRWHRLHLMNGWMPPPSILNEGHPAYAVSGGVVDLRGVMSSGTSQLFAHLPPGARPKHNLAILIDTFNGVSGALIIDADGEMDVFGGNATTFASLAAVSFPRTS